MQINKIFVFLVILVVVSVGCGNSADIQVKEDAASNKVIEQVELPSRESKIPYDIEKMMPEMDEHPPILYSDEYEEPVPVPGLLNTAGGEDSAFVMPDGNTMYFFFTPDVRVPVEKQVIDEVTGIYVSRKVNGTWQEVERVVLQDTGKLALDGCEFIRFDEMWFCSAREGYTGVHWFKAEQIDGKWTNWRNADDELKTEDYETGELHINEDELFFHSAKEGGKGGYDIWMSKKIDGEWSEPENVDVVNTADTEGWPFISSDGQELWFTRTYMGAPAIFRSVREEEGWGEPEMILSQFAGEPTLDDQGNIYFTHHFYREGNMIEADIYVAYKK